MRTNRTLAQSFILMLAIVMVPAFMAANEDYGKRSSIRLGDDQPISLRFFGSTAADRFTRELNESFEGALQKKFVAEASSNFPAGFSPEQF